MRLWAQRADADPLRRVLGVIEVLASEEDEKLRNLAAEALLYFIELPEAWALVKSAAGPSTLDLMERMLESRQTDDPYRDDPRVQWADRVLDRLFPDPPPG